ncbi:hypothetical protein COV82_06530 [Candidatus Peregrinibacteria bacterium CG11_big_fil_rev_8_21_14_0_20_46_8]|nr:MAG: hypothetical protein COV82_06530 [Candidatus Peregrinibacteria bacterium CG11_big_fil_rev_8_21_14_0_20_46_8]
MKRKISGVALILAGLFVLFISSASAQFSDTGAHKYREAIQFIQDRDIVDGYPDGTYRPDQTMNRAELLTIIVGSRYDNLPFLDCFTDVKRTEWYAAFVCKGQELGFASGYPDGSFQPARTVNFVEALIMLQRAYDIEVNTNGIWYEDSVRKGSTANHIPLDITKFDQPFTRGQMADMMTRFIRSRENSLDEYLGDRAAYRVTFESIGRGESMEARYHAEVGGGNAENNTGGVARNPGSVPSIPNNAPAADAGSAGSSDATRVYTSIPALAFNGFPPVGQNFTDPTFGTTIRRLSGARDRNDFGIHDYSQLQAFSADNRLVLVQDEGGYKTVNVSDGATVCSFPGINDPRWQSAQTDTLVFYDSNEDETIRLQYGNARTCEIETILTFPARYERISVNQSFDEISRDGRWLAGMAAIDNNQDRMIFTVDLQNRRIEGEQTISGLFSGTCAGGERDPDWIAAAPSGEWAVVNWAQDGDRRCEGQEVFNVRTLQYIGHSYDGRQHGDLAIHTDGRVGFVTTALSSPEEPNLPAIMFYPLPDGVNRPELIKTIPWGGLDHISCRGPAGMCLVTGGDSGDIFHEEIYMVYFDGSVRRLAHSRSSNCGYWVQPRASLSQDARYAIFDSDFATQPGLSESCGGNLGFEDPDGLGGGESFLIILPDAIRTSPNNATGSAGITGGNGDDDGVAAANNDDDGGNNGGAQANAGVQLGTVGALPNSTYTLAAGESVTFDEADAAFGDLLLEHTLGGDGCNDENFIIYDFYVKASGANQYTHIGHHEASEFGNWLGTNEVTGGGCFKGTFVYNLEGSGMAAVCITNEQNLTQRYCTTTSF